MLAYRNREEKREGNSEVYRKYRNWGSFVDEGVEIVGIESILLTGQQGAGNDSLGEKLRLQFTQTSQ